MRGEGGLALGLNKVKFSQSPLWILLHWSDPPDNIWWLSRSSPPSPHVFIFQANLSGPPSESFQSFQWSPLLGSHLRLIPTFVLLKVKWSPPHKSFPPPLPTQVINNDQSLRLWIPRCGFRILGANFRLLGQWNLDSGFQLLEGFRIP